MGVEGWAIVFRERIEQFLERFGKNGFLCPVDQRLGFSRRILDL
jgi:hypothetical protein